jgi:hypothetical protein
MASNDKPQAGVKFHDGWYFTIRELAERYSCSESLIRKRITYSRLDAKYALGIQVFKDDPGIFAKKPKGPPKGSAAVEGGKRIGNYGELFLIVQRVEVGNKEIYQKQLEIETKLAEVTTLLLNLLDVNTTPSHPTGTQGGLFATEAKK